MKKTTLHFAFHIKVKFRSQKTSNLEVDSAWELLIL